MDDDISQSDQPVIRAPDIVVNSDRLDDLEAPHPLEALQNHVDMLLAHPDAQADGNVHAILTRFKNQLLGLSRYVRQGAAQQVIEAPADAPVEDEEVIGPDLPGVPPPPPPPDPGRQLRANEQLFKPASEFADDPLDD